jgi:hypothetical protein
MQVQKWTKPVDITKLGANGKIPLFAGENNQLT